MKLLLLTLIITIIQCMSSKAQHVWDKLPKINSNLGIDTYGNVIKYDEYGNRGSSYGWEVDHIYPKSKGGSNSLDNLQALQWKENLNKADTINHSP